MKQLVKNLLYSAFIYSLLIKVVSKYISFTLLNKYQRSRSCNQCSLLLTEMKTETSVNGIKLLLLTEMETEKF